MLSWGGTGSAARTASDRTRELTSHIARDFLHLCKESGGLYGPYGPAHPWNSVALEGGGLGLGRGVHCLGAHSVPSVCGGGRQGASL